VFGKYSMIVDVTMPPPEWPQRYVCFGFPYFFVKYRRRFSTSLIESFTFHPGVRNVVVAEA
jgi:hypothetical protein